ncbi:hypothetical protein EHS25_009512 [Saitozyma podzolica]|uniref:Uncharacterized protein n=1 Tax=Saitozyma podzolica TaxID=1890683 RepID=A0A427YJG7_9TREE|nr:hypothetical protein EHS25_009512 [Saitozyma podzolica]
MPVTKKKGAIFAIYADSPGRDPSGPSDATNPELRSRSPSKRPSAGGVPGQTVQTGQASRKALSSVQPRSIGFPSAPSSALKPKSTTADGNTALDSDFPLKPTPKPVGAVGSTNPKPLATSRRSNPPPPPKTAPSKRQLEIFSSPSAPQPQPQQQSITSSRPIPPTSHTTSTGASTSAFSSTSHQPVSPAKRTRSSPTTAEVQYDKENHPPSALDSPASRTRSRTRLPLSAVPASPAVATKNRLIAKADGKLSSSPKKSALKAGTNGLKAREVRADGPLVDVSEAYGASGAEPDGFKTQGQ